MKDKLLDMSFIVGFLVAGAVVLAVVLAVEPKQQSKLPPAVYSYDKVHWKTFDVQTNALFIFEPTNNVRVYIVFK